MTIYLLSETFSSEAKKEINKARFDTLLKANNVVNQIWDPEETFTLLVNSFLDLEEYILHAGLNYHYRRDIQRDSDRFFDDARQAFNLKLISALTASRVYEEQLHQRLSSLSKLLEVEIDLKPIFSSTFDSSIECRVMYALRNYALHHQLPLSIISFSGSNLFQAADMRDMGPSRHRITVNPKISVKDFCDTKKIRSQTRKEVAGLGAEYLDLKFFARGFLSNLARCHESFRSQTKEILANALEDLKSAYEELRSLKGDTPIHVSIYECGADQKLARHYIDYATKARLEELRTYWIGLKSVQRCYVSSEISSSKDTYPKSDENIWISD